MKKIVHQIRKFIEISQYFLKEAEKILILPSNKNLKRYKNSMIAVKNGILSLYLLTWVNKQKTTVIINNT
jgi:hypothetical protein